MKTFAWLATAGVIWLALVQVSEHLGYPPQLVTLARSGYLGTFAIFMLLDLRREGSDAVPERGFQGVNLEEFFWFLVPLLSLGILVAFSIDLVITPTVFATATVFYVCQLGLLIARNGLGQMRAAGWDLVPPLLLATLLLSPSVVLVAATVGVFFIAWALVRGAPAGRGAADSLIMQVPSLCLAPVLLIAIRDVFDFGGATSRANVETFGMIVNGVGAAIWTAVVMRVSNRLAKLAKVLWALGTTMALVLLLIPASVALFAVAIVIAEIFRGSLWIGTTHLLKSTSRWSGFGINLVATGLPFTCLWLVRSSVEPHAVMTIYAAFHTAVPLSLWAHSRWRESRSL